MKLYEIWTYHMRNIIAHLCEHILNDTLYPRLKDTLNIYNFTITSVNLLDSFTVFTNVIIQN